MGRQRRCQGRNGHRHGVFPMPIRKVPLTLRISTQVFLRLLCHWYLLLLRGADKLLRVELSEQDASFVE